ncbi:MAG: relaxase [Chitinophagaceae bacterium]|nr:MAG: relaxase [Chitinophagaceae bacterium]
MIGKVITGKSFRGCLTYCLSDKKLVKESQADGVKNRPSEVLLFNRCCGGAKELSRQFEEVRRLNPRQSKPVLHITLSMAPGERLGRPDLLNLVETCAKHMGFEKNQFIAVEHLDTKHQHLHIVANRVGYDGRVVSDANSYKRIADFCRRMEREMGLQPVLSPKRFLPKEMRAVPRQDLRKKALKEHLQQKLLSSHDYTSFEVAMKSLGYRVERGRGIAFIDQKGVRTKGSEVGYPLGRIERILSQKQSTSLQRRRKENGAALSSHSAEKNIEPPHNQTSSVTKDLLDALLRIEKESEEIPHGLLQQKKRDRPRRPHL